MPHYRGDIIEVFFELPYSELSKSHPAIIISNSDVYEQDGIYICLMMTHLQKVDTFTFQILDEMLVKKSDGKFSQARCHIITYVSEKHIIKNKNFNCLKSNAVDRLIARINVVSFSKD